MALYAARSPRLHLLVSTVACLLLVISTTGIGYAQGSFTSFDGPHAGTQSGSVFQAGTFPIAINRWGCIALMTVDDNGVTRGFVREPNGTYVTVHPPTARSTFIAGINASGEVAGWFIDSQRNTHGFIKSGPTYRQLDAPDATYLTALVGINDAGQVAGNFANSGAGGTFFWDPANPTKYVVYTVADTAFAGAAAINASGQIAGGFTDSNFLQGGYLRNPDGTITKFKLLGGEGEIATQLVVRGMNKFGSITGDLFDAGINSGFIRFPGGGDYLFGSDSKAGPQSNAINDKGVIVGHLFFEIGENIAFVRDQTGTITHIPVPFTNIATDATGINVGGHIVGTYTDTNGTSHGWVE